MCFKNDIYRSQGNDENNMGQVHFEKNVYQSYHPNIGDYAIVYGSTQMCVYCDVDWVGNMDDHKSHQVMFLNWEMVLLVGIVRSKPLLLCYLYKLNIW